MQLLLNDLVLKCLATKREKRENEWGKKNNSESLNPLETTLDGGVGTMSTHLYVYTSGITSNHQNTHR